MKLWKRDHQEPRAPEPARPECSAGVGHCHEVLVLHADGTAECEGHLTCELDPSRHEHWLACTELVACGCTGEDLPPLVELPLAA